MENCLCNSTKEVEMFLGVPFNIASYALLCMMMAQVCGLEVEIMCILWRCSYLQQSF
jgi:hypothetical protein